MSVRPSLNLVVFFHTMRHREKISTNSSCWRDDGESTVNFPITLEDMIPN